MTDTASPTGTTKADWTSDQEPRWCPGCGDYSVLTAMQLMLPDMDVRPESTVFISGIGCAARFPYYMNTYGMHSIHGRAPAVATGLAARELPPDELMPAVRKLAARIAEHPLGSLRHTKRLMKAPQLEAIRAARVREDDGFRERIGSPENIEAIKAFFEKRRPDFSNLS